MDRKSPQISMLGKNYCHSGHSSNHNRSALPSVCLDLLFIIPEAQEHNFLSHPCVFKNINNITQTRLSHAVMCMLLPACTLKHSDSPYTGQRGYVGRLDMLKMIIP